MNKMMESPDIFWIVTDEHRCDGIGAYGNPWIKTPNLDRLAENGVLFERTYCQTPACVASRVSFKSGWYSHKTGNMWFEKTPDNIPYFIDYLKNAGYKTVNLGKEHHNRPTSPFEDSLFKDVDETTGFRIEGTPAKIGERFIHMEEELGVLHRYTVPDKPLIVAGTNPLPAEKAEAAFLVDHAIDYLKDFNAQQPIMLRISVLYPHTPVLPPKPYDTMYNPEDMVLPTDGKESVGRTEFELKGLSVYGNVEGMQDAEIKKMRAHYYGLCSYVDNEIGRFIDYLEKNWNRPYLIVFNADHGNLLGEYGLHEKFCMYENAVRVPFIISGHGIPKGKRISKLVELVDLAPTLMNVTNVGIREEMGFQGRDLLPLIENESIAWRDAAFTEYQPMHIGDMMMFPALKEFAYTEIEGKRGLEFTRLEAIAKEKGLDIKTMDNAPEGSKYRFWRPIFKSIRTDRYVLTVRATWVDGQGDDLMGSLHDLEKDPFELVNRFEDSEYAEIRRLLLDKLKDWDMKTSI